MSEPNVPPLGSNPLTIALGKKLVAVRAVRGITDIQASEQLGLGIVQYRYLESGKFLPGPNLVKRMYQWMLQGISFEGAPPLTETHYSHNSASAELKPFKARLPKVTVTKLAEESFRLGCSSEMLAQILIERGLEGRPAFATMKDAIETVYKVRNRIALAEAPEFRDILQSELPIVKNAGTVLQSWNQIPHAELPIEQLAKLQLNEELKEEWEEI